MNELKERYVTDREGRRLGVVLDVSDYERLMEEVEELESIRAFDRAKASSNEAIPFEQAVAEIQTGR